MDTQKASVPGLEKIEGVQDILEQNKCACPAACWFIPISLSSPLLLACMANILDRSSLRCCSKVLTSELQANVTHIAVVTTSAASMLPKKCNALSEIYCAKQGADKRNKQQP